MKLSSDYKINNSAIVKQNLKKEKLSNSSKELSDSDYRAFSKAITNQNKTLISFGHNKTWLKENIDDSILDQRQLIFDSVDGFGFEKLLAQIFNDTKTFGEVELTQSMTDGGIDIVFNKDNKKTVVQIKKYNAPANKDIVASLDYCKNKFNIDNAILIAASGVDDEAFKYAKELNKNYSFKILNLDDVIKIANKSNIIINEEYILPFSNEEKLKEKEEIKKKVIELFNKGKTYQQIADEIGCSHGTIGRYLKKWGIEKEKVDIEQQKDRIIELFNDGKTQQHIADEIGCSKATIGRYLRQWGIEKENPIEQQKDLIIELFNEGYTQQQIADEIGCSQGTIGNYLKQWGTDTKRDISILPSSTENYDEISKLTNRQLACKMAEIFEYQGYEVNKNNEFYNGTFTIANENRGSLVKVINSNYPVGVDYLRACASYLENGEIDDVILIAPLGVTRSNETEEILDSYKDKLFVLDLNEIEALNV